MKNQFQNAPSDVKTLLAQFKPGFGKLEFRARSSSEQPVIYNSATKTVAAPVEVDPIKRYAMEVVSAREDNGFRMSMETFLDLWKKA
jgi:hypothetical protein